jgi:2-isopropylmalate synthase
VFTAFSGSHQDAIKKGMTAMGGSNSGLWEVPYLPIDPKDIGRSYEAVIRINSQSGKGGVAYVLGTDHGLDLPRRLQIEFSRVVQDMADATGKEITSAAIWDSFTREYLDATAPLAFIAHRTLPETHASERRQLTAEVTYEGRKRVVEGHGNGPIDAFVDALRRSFGIAVRVLDYREHAVGSGADARAVAYVEAEVNGRTLWGVAQNANIVTASLTAICSAVNRAARQ